ncbi:MAG: indole-3-glycerol phosphate synthase TrpC [Armatimonadetes bacterium]|nr:indole-3-glycerol phosphate synthase TrpC [Armatimonadota bacterium]
MTILDKIFSAKRTETEDMSTASALAEWKARAADAPPVRGFASALRNADRPVALIAEVKKASPSRGVIRADFDPGEIARAYAEAGAHALSVLTDVSFFQGSIINLKISREATSLPVLRKDFTVRLAQVYETRAIGADAVLLIVNGLSLGELQEFYGAARETGLDVLVEAHTREEAETALSLGADLIGINNRNLQTFEEDLNVSCLLIPEIADRATIVSESSIRNVSEVRRVSEAGARAVLIGTSFCAALDPGAKVKEVMGW